MGRSFAVLEVFIVFALTHSAFRMIRHFTAWGDFERTHSLNWTPGLCMMAATACLWWIHRQRDPLSRAAFGLSPTSWPLALHAGIVATVIGLTLSGGIGVALLGFGEKPAQWTAFEGAVFGLLGIASAIGLLFALRGSFAIWLGRRSVLWGAAILAAAIAAPIAVTARAGDATGPVIAAVAWRVIAAGIGEELFFRGYLQGRLNQAFGTPYRLLGIRFGFGLIGASILFGLVHLLNPYNTFTGAGELAWGHGLATAGALSYGVLRERCGSVVAPIAVHVLIDVLVLIPRT